MSVQLIMSVVVLALGLSASACGDDCDQGYLDTYGICSPDGYAWQRADAVVSALVTLWLAVDENSTGACPDGGTVTISGSSSCYPPVCSGTYTYTFEDCLVEYNDFRERTVHFESGSLTDSERTVTDNGSMTFFHDVAGSVRLSGQVLVKDDPRQFGPETCAMDFSHFEDLFGTPVIGGTMCGDEIDQPLYE